MKLGILVVLMGNPNCCFMIIAVKFFFSRQSPRGTVRYWTISIKIHRTVFFYYYTTLPIICTGWKISLHLQIYVLVDLKNMGRNIYKTSTYNGNLRVCTESTHCTMCKLLEICAKIGLK